MESLEGRQLLTFNLAVNYAMATGPQDVVTADFNGDGKDDFALVAMETYYDMGGPVQLIMGTGTGTPGSPSYISSSTTNRSVAAGDVNSDGKLDLLTVSTSQSTTNVGVYPGAGTGSFGTAQLYETGRYSTSITLSDFNGDSKTDILAANPDNGTVSVLLGTGTGVFRPPLSAVTGTSPVAVAVGDFNGDGRADAVSANAGSNNVSVLLNDGAWIAADAPSLTINDVTVTEGNIGTITATFTVTLSSASTQTVTVNYATADGIAIGGSDFQSKSGTTPFVFTVTLSALYDAPVTVDYFTSDLTNEWIYYTGYTSATAGTDYQASSGTLTFAAGQTTANIPVTVKGDLLAEHDEYFSLQLSDPTNAGIDFGWANGAILDDDTPPSIYISGDGIYEGNSGTKLLTFTVSLSQVSSKTVQVSYATVNGTAKTGDKDYTARSGTLYFAPGEMAKTISVVIKGDTKKEKDEYFYVKLSRPVNSTISTAQATGSIWNDDGVSARSSLLSFSSALDEAADDFLTGRSRKRRR